MMPRRINGIMFQWVVLVLVLVSSLPVLTLEPDPVTRGKKTSIVVMLADDLGIGDVEYLRSDSNKGARTPELNTMARSENAYQMNNFHSAGTSCSPTRSSFLSGRTPTSECVLGANYRFDLPYSQYRDNYPFRTGMGSIARYARAAGYATAFFGKWHLGQFPKRSPGRMGFDTWVASTGNVPTYDSMCLERSRSGRIGRRRRCPIKMTPRRRRRCTRRRTTQNVSPSCYVGHYGSVRNFPKNWSPRMFEPDALNKLVRKANITRKIMSSAYLVDRFESFVSSTPDSVPIFAFIWFHEPHAPFYASPELASRCMAGIACKGTSATLTRAVDYYSTINALDSAVGRVRRILRAANRDQDTLVIFTSDNGPASPVKEGAVGSAAPYKGWKGEIHEGSHRVPTIIEWPARIKRNAIVHGLASSVDFFNTFRNLFLSENTTALDFSSIQSRSSEGESLLAVFSADHPENWTRSSGLGICRASYGRVPVCKQFSYLEGTWRIIATRRRTRNQYNSRNVQLYNIDLDPLETTNLATTNKEVLNKLLPRAVVWVSRLIKEYQDHC